MEIIVCIKQVPDTEEMHRVRISAQTHTLVREGIKSVINPFDENALEEALRLRERHQGRVTVLSMGPPQAQEALRRALAMGADRAVLLSDASFAGADTWATSYTLAAAIRRLGAFDLILSGKQAIDGDTAQVGPGVAEWLDIPQVTYARKITVENGRAEVERSLEDAFETVATPLPALITVTKEINDPRYPSLKGLLKAKKMEIPVWKADDISVDRDKIGLDGSTTRVVDICTPEAPTKGEILEGECSQKVERLVVALREAKLL